MPNLAKLSRIRNSLSPKYIQTSSTLSEEKENMYIKLFENSDYCVILSPDDDDKTGMWKYFNKSVDREIADYIVFTQIDNSICAFIIELKKSNNEYNRKKAGKQLRATLPMVKMIYEKIMEESADQSLSIIGIKVFGSQKRDKVKNKLTYTTTATDKFSIFNFIQTSGCELTSFKHLLDTAIDKAGKNHRELLSLGINTY